MRILPFFLLVLVLLLAQPLTAAAVEEPATGGTAELKGGVLDDADFDADFGDEFDDSFNEGDAEDVLISDPFETYNRGIFWFNDKLYVYLLKPVVKVYRVVPHSARASVGNFFANLSSPISIVNASLQLKFGDALRGVYRLVTNTTLGIGGLFDPADHWAHVPRKKEDFGQTLGHYGVGQGPYFVLPIFGPSSIRDTTGYIVDIYFDPLAYTGDTFSFLQYVGIKSLDFTNRLSLDDDNYEKIKRDSLDPYLFMRAAYAQYRLAKVKE